MRGFGTCAVIGFALGLAGCGGRPEQRPAAATDTTEAEPAPPPRAATQVAEQSANEQPEQEYLIRGVCPFECCKYGGTWTLIHGGALRAEPSETADSVGSVTAGTAVHTDEGAMVLHPAGLAVVVPDTSHAASGPAVGDTVEVITYTGAKVSHVRWHDQEADMNWSGLHMIRDPLQTWWVHMTEPVTGAAGWLPMSGVSAQDVGAPNSCTKPK